MDLVIVTGGADPENDNEDVSLSVDPDWLFNKGGLFDPTGWVGPVVTSGGLIAVLND